MAAILAWLLAIGTPLSILVFLTCFLVWMGQGTHDTRLTRLCSRLMVPAGLATMVCLISTLRYF